MGGTGEAGEGCDEMNENRFVELAKHAIGMRLRKPYKRHGRLFYRPYRNYFSTAVGCDDYERWETLEDAG